MRGHVNFNQRGIALIQVLIIAIILTMLGIFINQSVRNQVKTAQLIQDNYKLNLLLESTEAELLHALLTHKRYRKDDSDNDFVKRWNFHGEIFTLNDQVSIELQDLNGLLSLNYMNNSVSTRLFEQLGESGHNVRTFLDSLKDWKDKDDLKHLNGAESYFYQKEKLLIPRNGFLQSVQEVTNIKGADIFSKEQWSKYYSLALVSKYNPLNSPERILKAFLNDDQKLEQVINLRNQNQLNLLSFYQATGVETDDVITFSTGRLLTIKIMVYIENNKLSKSFQVVLRPNANLRPVTISNVKWNDE
jgi:general secretion pathway protein K